MTIKVLAVMLWILALVNILSLAFFGPFVDREITNFYLSRGFAPPAGCSVPVAAAPLTIIVMMVWLAASVGYVAAGTWAWNRKRA